MMMASSGGGGGGALNKIERAHTMYRQGNYQDALVFYTEALSIAKTNPQKIALHSNRAACFLKLHDFKKAADECTSVLELDHNHTGALMLRAQTLVTLKEYHSALFDVNRLIELNPSSEVYKNLEARLRTQLIFDENFIQLCEIFTFCLRKSLAPIPESDAELEEEEEDGEADIDRNEVLSSEGFGGDAKSHAVEGTDEKAQLNNGKHDAEYNILAKGADISSEQTRDQKTVPQTQTAKESSKGWQAIPKPKGHSTLDYARWDRVADDSSEDEDDDEDEDTGPQYRFRVRTVGVRPVN